MINHSTLAIRSILSSFPLVIALHLIGCSDEGTAPLINPSALDQKLEAALIVSQSVVAAASGQANGLSAGAAATPGEMAYTSLPSQTFADATAALLLNKRTGVSRSVTMIDGGFDPVVLEATEGDTVAVEVFGNDGKTLATTRRVTKRKPPTVVRTDPPRGRRDVPINALMKIVFSEPVSPISVTTQTIQLLANDGGTVAGSLRVIPGREFEVEFSPATALDAESRYVLLINPGVADLDGTSIVSNYASEFFTPRGTGAIAGVVTVGGGAPIVAVFVEVVQLSAAGPKTVRTSMSADGSFAFGGLAAGEYEVKPQIGGGAEGPLKCERQRLIVIDGRGESVHLTCTSDPVGRIFVADADGMGAVQIGSGNRPAWSPDGRRIAVDRDMTIYVMDADGSNERAVVRGMQAAWSPSGDRIAFGDGKGISVVNVDGSARQRMYTPPFGNAGRPRWSVDGRYIAFQDANRDHYGFFDSYVRVVDASSPSTQTWEIHGANAEQVGAPSWAPDGTLSVEITGLFYYNLVEGPNHLAIATVSDFSNPVLNRIYEYPNTTGALHDLRSRSDWSHDGERMAFAMSKFTSQNVFDKSIYVIGRHGGPLTLLISDADDPAWSPVAARIAFTKY